MIRGTPKRMSNEELKLEKKNLGKSQTDLMNEEFPTSTNIKPRLGMRTVPLEPFYQDPMGVPRGPERLRPERLKKRKD